LLVPVSHRQSGQCLVDAFDCARCDTYLLQWLFRAWVARSQHCVCAQSDSRDGRQCGEDVWRARGHAHVCGRDRRRHAALALFDRIVPSDPVKGACIRAALGSNARSASRGRRRQHRASKVATSVSTCAVHETLDQGCCKNCYMCCSWTRFCAGPWPRCVYLSYTLTRACHSLSQACVILFLNHSSK
jgi:hypothetical protein